MVIPEYYARFNMLCYITHAIKVVVAAEEEVPWNQIINGDKLGL